MVSCGFSGSSASVVVSARWLGYTASSLAPTWRLSLGVSSVADTVASVDVSDVASDNVAADVGCTLLAADSVAAAKRAFKMPKAETKKKNDYEINRIRKCFVKNFIQTYVSVITSFSLFYINHL